MCCSVNVSVCFVCCVLDSVCELFGETIRNELALDVFAITERRDMGLYEVRLSVSLLGFGIGTMLANFHV